MLSDWVPAWEKVAICGPTAVALLLVTFVVEGGIAPYVGGGIAMAAVLAFEQRKRIHDPSQTTPEKS